MEKRRKFPTRSLFLLFSIVYYSMIYTWMASTSADLQRTVTDRFFHDSLDIFCVAKTGGQASKKNVTQRNLTQERIQLELTHEKLILDEGIRKAQNKIRDMSDIQKNVIKAEKRIKILNQTITDKNASIQQLTSIRNSLEKNVTKLSEDVKDLQAKVNIRKKQHEPHSSNTSDPTPYTVCRKDPTQKWRLWTWIERGIMAGNRTLAVLDEMSCYMITFYEDEKGALATKNSTFCNLVFRGLYHP